MEAIVVFREKPKVAFDRVVNVTWKEGMVKIIRTMEIRAYPIDTIDSVIWDVDFSDERP